MKLGHAGFVGRVLPAAGDEIDLHVENRQAAAFDEIHLGARWGDPVLDLRAGLDKAGKGGDQQGKQ